MDLFSEKDKTCLVVGWKERKLVDRKESKGSKRDEIRERGKEDEGEQMVIAFYIAFSFLRHNLVFLLPTSTSPSACLADFFGKKHVLLLPGHVFLR